jgi:hypothetical protein
VQPPPTPEDVGATLSVELLKSQQKIAIETYLNEQRQTECPSVARSRMLAECPTGVTPRAPAPPNHGVLPPLLPEEPPLTDEELERRASIKGIQLFNFKF